MVNLYFVATCIVVYINLFILAPLISKQLSYTDSNNSDGTVMNNAILRHFTIANNTKKSPLHIQVNSNAKRSRDFGDVWEVHRIVKREDDNGDDDEGDSDDEKDDDEDEKDEEKDSEDDEEKDSDDDDDDTSDNKKTKLSSNETANVNDTSESFDVEENLSTTTKVYVYPYTDEVIDFVADNGLKYTSTSSDQMRELNETSDTSENFARITDDSEPLHFVISGESDLSKATEEDVGIENLLPDYVKPTIPTQEEPEEKTEKVNEEDEIMLSEEIETTTTEATTRYQNSYEFHGERYESSEEGNSENMTLTTTPNSTDVSDDMEYKDYDMISATLMENITSTTSENITAVNETTSEVTTSTEITTLEPVAEEIFLDTTSTTTTTPATTKKKKLSTIDTVESAEIQNMTDTLSTVEDAEDYDPFGENNFSVFHPYSKENSENTENNSSDRSVEVYTINDDLEEFTTPHYLNLHLKQKVTTKPLLLLKRLNTDSSISDSSNADDNSDALPTPVVYTSTTINIIANESDSNKLETIHFNDTTTNIYNATTN